MTPIDRPTAFAALLAIGLTLVLGAWCRFQINGRRFRRRTIGGGQRFPSYRAAVFTQAWEGLTMGLAKLLMGLAAVGAIWLIVILYRSG